MHLNSKYRFLINIFLFINLALLNSCAHKRDKIISRSNDAFFSYTSIKSEAFNQQIPITYCYDGKFSDGKKIIKEKTKGPSDLNFWNLTAICNLLEKNFILARYQLNMALSLTKKKSTIAIIKNNLAYTFWETKNKDIAHKILKSAYKDDRSNPVINFNLANLYLEFHHHKLAQKHIANLKNLSNYSTDPSIVHLSGTYEMQKGNFKKALYIYKLMPTNFLAERKFLNNVYFLNFITKNKISPIDSNKSDDDEINKLNEELNKMMEDKNKQGS